VVSVILKWDWLMVQFTKIASNVVIYLGCRDRKGFNSGDIHVTTTSDKTLRP
jgi:hypothetical protein